MTDSGRGMEPELPEDLRPFFTTKGAGGTGLGLATVHNIVGHWGGTDLGCHGALGRGSSFVVHLPEAA